MAEFILGHDVDSDLLQRAIELDDEVGPAPRPPHPGIATGRLPLALTLKWTDDFDRARQLLESLRREHLERGDEGALAPVLFHFGELECWAGNWTAAGRIAQASHELASHSGQGVAESRALTLDAMLASYRGDADAVYALAATSLAAAERAGDPPAMMRSLGSLGTLALSLGDPETAAIHFDRGLEIEADAGYDPATVRIAPDAIEALLAVGRQAEAEGRIEDLERRGVRSNRPWPRAMGARCRGLLEAARGHLDEAEAMLAIAVREHDRLPQPFERARTLSALGMVQRRAKQKRPARDSLEAALRLFDLLGASLWAARVRVEIGRIGGRATSAFALTPTEEQVASLVADGRTNREVASALFMSVKTVETNLTRVYRKLGVTSRRDLAARRPVHDNDGWRV